MYPFSLSAGMGSGPFNLISDSHCRDGDPVGGSLYDARDWVHAVNGQWVDVSTLMGSSPLARSAYFPKLAVVEQSYMEKGCAVGRRICNHQLLRRYHQSPPRYNQLLPRYHQLLGRHYQLPPRYHQFTLLWRTHMSCHRTSLRP